MPADQRIDQIINLLKEESSRNDGRFVELKAADEEIKTSIHELRRELKSEINKVYTSLSEDIQVFAQDHEKLQQRVERIERKIA